MKPETDRSARSYKQNSECVGPSGVFTIVQAPRPNLKIVTQTNIMF